MKRYATVQEYLVAVAIMTEDERIADHIIRRRYFPAWRVTRQLPAQPVFSVGADVKKRLPHAPVIRSMRQKFALAWLMLWNERAAKAQIRREQQEADRKMYAGRAAKRASDSHFLK